MTRFLVCFLIGLVALTGRGFPGQLVVNILPTTITQADHSGDLWDTITVQGTSLTSPTTGLRLASTSGVEVHHWVIMLDQDTVFFGAGGGNSMYGLELARIGSYYPHDVELVGGYFLHAAGGTPNLCDGITGTGYNITLAPESVFVTGTNAQALRLRDGDVYGEFHTVDLIGGKYVSASTAYTSRCLYDGAVILIDDCRAGALVSGGGNGLYHVLADGVVIGNGPGQGLVIVGRESGTDRARAIVRNCDITLDAQNTFYPSYSGTCLSSSNPYGIHLRWIADSTLVYSNTIRSGNAAGGCRGIILEYGEGTEANPIQIYGNDVLVHEGPNVEYGDNLPVHGLRLRYSPLWVWVHNNLFQCDGDGLAGTDAYGQGLMPIRFSWDAADIPCHVTIENNRGIANDTSLMISTAYAFVFEGDDAPGPVDSSIIVQNNFWSSTSVVAKYGHANAGGAGIYSVGDTFHIPAGNVSPQTFEIGHLGNAWDCSTQVVLDGIFLGAANDSDITFTTTNGQSDITLRRTLDVYVRGNNGLPVVGASVTVTDAYDVVQLSGSSSSGGLVSGVVDYLRSFNNPLDSVFRPMQVVASAGSFADTVPAWYVNWSPAGGTDTLDLDTVGAGSWDAEPEPSSNRKLRGFLKSN